MKNFPADLKPKTIVRQEADYEAAGIPAERVIPLPFDLACVNSEVLIERGATPAGVVRQMNQVFLENIGNALGSKARAAFANNVTPPSQEDVDAMVAAYDFSGIRASGGDSGLPESERLFRTELRAMLRAVARDGALDPEGNPLTVQTAKEAKEDKLPEGKISLEDFDSIVEAAAEGVAITYNELEFDFGAEVSYIEQPDGTRQLGSYSAISDFAREQANEKLALKQRSAGLRLATS